MTSLEEVQKLNRELADRINEEARAADAPHNLAASLRQPEYPSRPDTHRGESTSSPPTPRGHWGGKSDSYL